MNEWEDINKNKTHNKGKKNINIKLINNNNR